MFQVTIVEPVRPAAMSRMSDPVGCFRECGLQSGPWEDGMELTVYKRERQSLLVTGQAGDKNLLQKRSSTEEDVFIDLLLIDLLM